ncbi:16S rRNA (guanine(527)-N(7))-methyltransferase RsmG [Shimazuella kribbensis]|uniref:16S rRNA (guanine(527)-N(7))-methyltransferase RsmG n=1 Tax=Shimazuella kribbensis TaxID=139808 RepID=UPI0003F5CFF9|nr:16S rRNA (guanine(527)-N(7))-methyltransferase RsmG [Shimazuella kribbensis]
MRKYLDEAYELSSSQLEQFAVYYRLLVEKNKVMNLTAITEEQEVYIKHFYDSLTITRVINMSDITTVLDVGTGAGFPGIPLKIAFPHLKLTLLDSLQKRIRFLQEVGEELGWDDVTYVHGRAEDIAQLSDYREHFDVVASRAVAKINVLAEYCLPFVRVGGKCIAMKGSNVTEEMSNCKQALFILGKSTHQVHPLVLPEKMGERNIITIDKKESIPMKYPRKSGVIKKSPL